ncbi:GNAT family N-acetyltransferase [uncultured Microbacterium sp.]|uniref:GNAT family N-acetyltransferase n=1 Tax=uncultured Microbacterium sp. TaxID=191216 RepID=UPI0025F18368|nr:GNAT family N-acetyltransferase [uncultured Microbacterium sp.]
MIAASGALAPVPLTAGAVLHPLVLPARAGAGPSPLHDYADARNRGLTESTGRDDDHLTPAQLLPLLATDAYQRRRQWRILREDRTVGVAVLNISLDAGGESAIVFISVLREVQGRGIGTAVAHHLEALARTDGVRTLRVWAEHPASDDPTIAAPTGFGRVPRDHTARFLEAQGWTLEQIDRVSAYPAGSDRHLRSLNADATAAAADYEVVQWMLPTPDQHRAGYAWMKSRMSTDAPDAGMETPEEIWDEERVRANDARWAAMGSTVQVTAARHRASGELAAFSELEHRGSPDAPTHQQDTLVLAAHRGHRLGLLVKTTGMLSWRERYPHSGEIITYNAEENRPMLSINEELGFAAIAYEGAWKKTLA